MRGSLLTGASAIALSLSASGAHGQNAPKPAPNPTLTFWVEGALFSTGGGSFNIPSLPGLGAPYTSFNPSHGIEGAVGFDYQWPSQPWHFVFDFRYGKSKTITSSSAASSSSNSFHNFQAFGTISGVLLTSTTDISTTKSTARQATERESHLVADFMIGRDLGLGAGKPEFQFGFRVVDLHAFAQAQQFDQTTTNTDLARTFYDTSSCPPCVASTSSHNSSSSSSFDYATWNSGFFGVGPRAAIAGGVPITGPWSFDYSGGIAGLFGPRTLNTVMWSTSGPGFAATYGSWAFVFNADAWVALTYVFTPQFKMSAGIRGDFYAAALTTYDINSGGLQNLNRIYWGPLVRLTGSF